MEEKRACAEDEALLNVASLADVLIAANPKRHTKCFATTAHLPWLLPTFPTCFVRKGTHGPETQVFSI